MTEDFLTKVKRLAAHGYTNADDVKRLVYELEDARQRLDPITSRNGVTDDDIRSMIGEGFHTAFRKAVDNPEAVVIHKLIRDMDAEEWSAVVGFVADMIIRALRRAELDDEEA